MDIGPPRWLVIPNLCSTRSSSHDRILFSEPLPLFPPSILDPVQLPRPSPLEYFIHLLYYHGATIRNNANACQEVESFPEEERKKEKKNNEGGREKDPFSHLSLSHCFLHLILPNPNLNRL